MILNKSEIENLKVGDYLPNVFNKSKKITNIFHKGFDINGKFYCCFYQEFSENSTMSNSVKENEPMNILNCKC